MGIQWDLCGMLGAPSEMTCPNCGKLSQTMFDDYDVDAGGWNPEPGHFALDCYCPHCEHEWFWKCRVEVEEDDA